MKPSLSSLYQSVDIRQDIPPLLIGERCNANGSKKFRARLLAEDDDGCVRMALEQEAQGAQVLDLCTAYAGRNEMDDLCRLVPLFANQCRSVLMIDSTTPDCIEACLKLYPGRCIVNSINLEDGGKNLHRICTLAKKYGAAVVALTIGPEGMAMTADEKLRVAKMIYHEAVEVNGLRPSDLLFDALTFTVGSGDETLRDAAVQTVEAIRMIKAELPGVNTVLGVSNISFGLRPAGRKVLNSVFLHEAVQAGLDAAIVDAVKVLPYASIDEQERELSLNLLHNLGETPLMSFIEHFEKAQPEKSAEELDNTHNLTEQSLAEQLIKGNKDGLEDLLSILIRRMPPLSIINNVLVPAMRQVGELFGRGEILLPFVLQSAEVMKRSVNYLEPYMDRSQQKAGLKILLATVQGDVHDIGKNLVDIILSNNGYQVVNIGIKVPAETIIAKAKEHKVDMVGLSGLLVKSAIVMKESMVQYREAGLNVPILLGGAALTQKFVAEEVVPGYDHQVVYCADAFAGLKAVRDFEAGRLHSTEWNRGSGRVSTPHAAELDVEVLSEVPTPPFWGSAIEQQINSVDIFPYMNLQALYRGRWGYRRAKLSAEQYDELLKNTVNPLYERLKNQALAEGWLQPKVAYGYFPCYRDGDRVMVQHGDSWLPFAFPRRSTAPKICIADYFRTQQEGGDVAAFFVVTIGERLAEEVKRLFEQNSYHDYLMWHGFGVEVTDALAELWHERMRRQMGIGEERSLDTAGLVAQEYRGSRYGFGYPSCPDMEAHIPMWQMLQPERIGVNLTENMEMVPEMSTSAIIVHHPQAKYFAV